MTKNHLRLGLIAAAALLVAGGLAAQAPQTLATATVYPGGVDIRPEVDFAGAILTVSSGERSYRYEFEARHAPSIGLLDPAGHPLPDGRYVWELELLPDEETARELREAAMDNGGRAPNAWQRLTGHFTLHGGAVALPDLPEAGAARAETRGHAGFAGGLSAPTLGGRSRGAAVDTDDAVGDAPEYEAGVAAASRGATPVAPDASAALVAPDPGERPDTDAATMTYGRTLEAPVAPTVVALPERSFAAAARPVSDGTNGRPRSDEVDHR